MGLKVEPTFQNKHLILNVDGMIGAGKSTFISLLKDNIKEIKKELKKQYKLKDLNIKVYIKEERTAINIYLEELYQIINQLERLEKDEVKATLSEEQLFAKKMELSKKTSKVEHSFISNMGEDIHNSSNILYDNWNQDENTIYIYVNDRELNGVRFFIDYYFKKRYLLKDDYDFLYKVLDYYREENDFCNGIFNEKVYSKQKEGRHDKLISDNIFISTTLSNGYNNVKRRARKGETVMSIEYYKDLYDYYVENKKALFTNSYDIENNGTIEDLFSNLKNYLIEKLSE